MDMAEESKKSKGIKAMPQALRPRERLYTHGAQVLSDAELLAILLGSGSPGETSIALAAKILSGFGGSVAGLSECGFASLCRHKGMGFAKASAILAAVELGRRMYSAAMVKLKVAT